MFGNPTVPLRNTLLPYALHPNNLLGSPQGYYTYNAMMTQIQRNFSNGLLFSLHYTWSRTIENWFGEAQGNNYAENAGTAPGTLDRRNLSNSYSISPNDIPHRVVATWVWTPPVGKGRALDLATGSPTVCWADGMLAVC